ncbi:type VI secretion system baseplate subunit TssF, partial [Pseudoduganella sp. RAF53_2]
MDSLLAHYEQELARLRRASAEFARIYPQLAHAISLSGEASSDPEVERLIQSIALLNAHTAERLEDKHEELTSAILASHQALRAFPSCAIAQIDYGDAKPNAISSVAHIPRGTMLKSHGTGSQICKFRTAYDINIAPITIAEACIAPIEVPAALRLPQDAASSMRLTINSTSSNRALYCEAPLRIHVSGSPAKTAWIMDAILMHTLCVCVQANDQWTISPASPFHQVGLSDNEALLPDTSALSCYRLLAEYFCFPEKFNFIDIDLPTIASFIPRCDGITLHLILPNLPHAGKLSRDSIRLGCTPIINLFPYRAAPIKLDAASSEYTLVPDQLPETACEIYSIDKVSLLHRSNCNEAPIEFMPYSETAPGGIQWLTKNSGNDYEHTLYLIDRARTPVALSTGALAIHLTCTNRDATQSLASSKNASELTTELNTAGFPIHVLEKPSPTQYLAARRSHWILLSLLHRAPRLPELIDILRLHAPITSTASQHMLEGLRKLSEHEICAWIDTRYMAGTRFRLSIDAAYFAGRSIYTFARVLNCFFRSRVPRNR